MHLTTTMLGLIFFFNSKSEGGVTEEGYVLEVEAGKTYLLRLINAALISEYYLKIAGHRFTVVAADANYVKPYATDVIAIAPGETVDALLVADAAPGRSYYVVALANQPSVANPPSRSPWAPSAATAAPSPASAAGASSPSSWPP
jgi:FtsP/CotA-like multicopper oxidase with cupredoxin domain